MNQVASIALLSVALTVVPRAANADPSPVGLDVGGSAGPALSAGCGGHCAGGLGGSVDTSWLVRFSRHGFGPEVEHVRVPWRFDETSYRTAVLLAYRYYFVSSRDSDAYAGVAFGSAWTRDFIEGMCAADASGLGLRASAGVRWTAASKLRVGAKLSFGAAGTTISCDAGWGSGSGSFRDLDRPVRATAALALELALVAMSSDR